MSDVPHGVDGGMTFVEGDEERRAGETFCQILTVQILPVQTKKSFESLSHDTVSFKKKEKKALNRFQPTFWVQ